MTNRKLKKKIRQAFEHATPDLAESIMVTSLLSDVAPKKGDEKPMKPIKTSIQFRAITTLAASIAVVTLLVGLLPKINPFAPSNNPDNTLGQSQTPTEPTDNIFINPHYTPADLQEILDAILATPDFPITEEDADFDVDVKKFEDNTFLDIEVTSKNPEKTDEFHFLADLDTKKVHAYSEDFDFSPFISTKYFDIPLGPDIFYNPTAQNNVLSAEFVLFNNQLSYALALDSGDNGQLVLINAETEKLNRSWFLIGSNKAAVFAFGPYEESLGDDESNDNASEWDSLLGSDWEWEFAYVDGKLCYEFKSDSLKFEALVDAITGEVIQKNGYGDDVDPTEVTTPVNTDPYNTEGPPIQNTTPPATVIDEQEALYKALGHAGLEKDHISDYRIELAMTNGVPRYEVEFYTSEHEYEYEISLTGGIVLRMEREYAQQLNPDDILNKPLDEEDIVWIVKNDPMIGFGVYRMSIVDPGKDDPCYLITCQSAKRADQSEYCYVIEFSKQHRIVLDLEIIYTNQFLYTDYYHDAEKTNYGNISDDTAIDAALYYADLDIYDVGTAYCDEGKLDSGIYKYNAHYDVYFNYEGCRYHYYIELYNGRLLGIEILSLSNNDELPEPEVIMSQWNNLQHPMPDIVTTKETDVELLREQAVDFGHYLYVKTNSDNQKLVDSQVSWSVDTGNGAIYISADKRSVFAVSYQDRQPIEIYRSTEGAIAAPDSFGVNMDLERQWLVIRDGDTLVQIDLAAGKSRQLVRHQNILPHYYIDHGETTVYFEISAGLYWTGYTIDMETGKLTEHFRL